jgi:hypothetical protein
VKALLVRLLVIVAMSAAARDASAYNITCNKVIQGGIVVHRTLSAPAGSARALAIQNAHAQWSRIMPIDRWIRPGIEVGGTHDLDTEPSMVGFASSGGFHLGGAIGRTFTRTSNCTITGIDILLSSELSYAAPPDSLPAGGANGADPGWVTALHEFGHGLGLSLNNSHSNFFAVMRASTPGPTFGAFPFATWAAAPAPDDAEGVRALYGTSNATVNVASSQTTLNPSGIIRLWNPPLSAGTFPVCRGESLDIPTHTSNTGITTVTINHRVYMQAFGAGNPWDAFHPQNVTLAEVFGSVHSSHNNFFRIVPARIPCGTPPGIYNVMHFADSSNSVPNEYNELDNTSRYPAPIEVLGCGC